MPQSVYHAELLRLLCGKGVLSYWPTCTVPRDPHFLQWLMAYRVDSSRSNDIGREEMHLVAGRPRPSTCRTSAVTRVSIPIVKHGRVL